MSTKRIFRVTVGAIGGLIVSPLASMDASPVNPSGSEYSVSSIRVEDAIEKLMRDGRFDKSETAKSDVCKGGSGGGFTTQQDKSMT